MDSSIFSEIAEKCPKKKVISCCKKLNKKCSYKSGADMEILCELAYWLYIYDHKDEVFAVAAETHNIPFVRNFNVWTWIFAIWGLEIRIWRERDCHQQAETLIAEIDACYHVSNSESETEEWIDKWEQKRRSGEMFTYPYCANRQRIEEETSKAWANRLRLTALYRMIGDGATGLFPLMNRDADLIEETVQEYIKILSTVP